MPMNEMQKQTNANIQAKANLIWEIATHLVGLFKPHEYGKVILPMTVLKRFDDALKPTKAAVVEMAKKLDAQHVEGTARDGILCRVAQYDFYNTSNLDKGITTSSVSCLKEIDGRVYFVAVKKLLTVFSLV